MTSFERSWHPRFACRDGGDHSGARWVESSPPGLAPRWPWLRPSLRHRARPSPVASHPYDRSNARPLTVFHFVSRGMRLRPAKSGLEFSSTTFLGHHRIDTPSDPSQEASRFSAPHRIVIGKKHSLCLSFECIAARIETARGDAHVGATGNSTRSSNATCCAPLFERDVSFARDRVRELSGTFGSRSRGNTQRAASASLFASRTSKFSRKIATCRPTARKRVRIELLRCNIVNVGADGRFRACCCRCCCCCCCCRCWSRPVEKKSTRGLPGAFRPRTHTKSTCRI